MFWDVGDFLTLVVWGGVGVVLFGFCLVVLAITGGFGLWMSLRIGCSLIGCCFWVCDFDFRGRVCFGFIYWFLI